MCKTSRVLVILTLAAVAVFPVRAQSRSQATVQTQLPDPFSELHVDLARGVDDLLARAAQTEASGAPVPDAVPEPSNVASRDLPPKGKSEPLHGPNAAMDRFEQLRPQLEPLLRREGIPAEIALVVVVESGAQADALSPKGARGLWQLMPDTARRYGLVVDEGRDDRLDVESSTRAAAQYLRDLYVQFQSWPLALAAYNAGEQAVERAVQRAPGEKFAVLSSRRLLPAETRSYVPAVIGLIKRSSSASYLTDEVSAGSPKERVVYAGLTN